MNGVFDKPGSNLFVINKDEQDLYSYSQALETINEGMKLLPEEAKSLNSRNEIQEDMNECEVEFFKLIKI